MVRFECLVVYVCVFVHYFDIAFCEDSGEFTVQPKHAPYLVKSNDSDVVLPCAVRSDYAKAPYTLNWIKIVNNSPRIITTGTNNFVSGLYELDAKSCAAGGAADGGCYNLHIQRVTYEHDNAKFFCQITGPNNFFKQSQPAEVVVLIKPSDAKITAQPSAPVREGSVVSVDCGSAGGNPPPRIQWFYNNGTEINAQFVKQTNATDVSSTSTVGNLQFIVGAAENGLRVVCKVWNEAMADDEPMLEALSLPLSVLYPPKVTVGPSSPYNVELGAPAILYCAADANPIPTRFTWFLNGNSQPVANGQNLTFTVTKSHNGRYTCVASNEDSSGQESVQLNVMYAPEISLNAEYRGVLSRSATLVCQVEANPAASSVGWTGPNGRSSETNILEIESVSLKDTGNYTCVAKNVLELTGATAAGVNNNRSSNKTTVLVVDHAPGKGQVSIEEPAVVGGVANLSCTSDDLGSPRAEYRWRLPGQKEFDATPRPTLTITNVQMAMAGEYACLPFNSIGPGEVGLFTLVVYEPARMEDGLHGNNSKAEGDATFSMSCSAKGSPAPNVTWYKDDELLEPSEHWFVSQKEEKNDCDVPEQCLVKVYGTLEWKSPVKWSDKGVYVCQAFNGAGVPARSNATLKVSHKPVIINDPTRPFVASDVAQEADIECKATARPEPTFRWYKDGRDVLQDSSSAYVVSQKPTSQSDDVYESTLTIRKVVEQDMGVYVCKATNALGDGDFKITLQLKTKPMAPDDVHVASHGYRSIQLGWTPGFDGGESQWFTVEYVLPDNTLRYANATESSGFNRFRRFVGIERTSPVTINITDLMPSSEYKFRVKATNRLGETEWTSPVVSWTVDAPMDPNIQQLSQAIYNTDTMVLDFKPTNLDLQTYCLLVYRQLSSGKYESQDCYPPTGRVEKLKPASNFKIRFCVRQTYACGKEYEVMTGVQSAITWEIIIAICASVLFVLLVALIVCIYCYRSRRVCNKKDKNASSTSTIGRTNNALGGQRKDYEMETNQIRPNLYQTDKIITASGAPLDQQQTGGSSSKDSGIYTTDNGYQYDLRYKDNVDGRAASASAGDVANAVGGPIVLNRTPSYDDQEHWGATDGYGLTNNYMSHHHQADYGGGSLGGKADLTSPYYDTYPVDMNPAGGGSTTAGNDTSSVHSGYSTPNGRRVMREIIV